MTEEERLDANIQRKTRLIKQIKHDLIIKIVGFFLILFITFTFIFGVTLAPSNDMFPAIHEGDLLIYFRLGRMDNKEIALYKTPTGTNIGRIQALEGSEIGITDGGLLTINGNIQPIQERSGLYYETYANDQGPIQFPSTIPENSFLILGDEREHAMDSRDYGYINKKDIKGKIFTIIRRRPL